MNEEDAQDELERMAISMAEGMRQLWLSQGLPPAFLYVAMIATGAAWLKSEAGADGVQAELRRVAEALADHGDETLN